MRSLRGRLATRLLVGAGLIVLAGAAVLDQQLELRMETDFDEGLLAKARTVANLAEQEHGRVWLEVDEASLPEFHAGRSAEYFEFAQVAGEVITRSSSLGDGRLAPPSRQSAGDVRFWNLSLPDGRSGRAIRLEFEPRLEVDEDAPSGATIGAAGNTTRPRRASLVIARERETLDRFVAWSRRAAVGFGLSLLLSIALLVNWGLRRELAPLTRLSERLAAMDSESLGDPRLGLDLPTEIEPVASRLADLLVRLKSSFERERTFSTRIAHELRTPLAELRTAGQVALLGPQNAAELAAALEQALAIGCEMERMVVNLLGLARLEAGIVSLEKHPVDLREAVLKALSSSTKVGEERQVEARCLVPPETLVEVAPGPLALALGNLALNAFEHAPSGTGLQVTYEEREARSELSFRNLAPDLATEDLPRLFERFWRKDAARAEGGHAGLGLALVLAVARALELDLRAELEAGGVLCISIGGWTRPSGNPAGLTAVVPSAPRVLPTRL